MYNSTLPSKVVRPKICPIIIMSLTRFPSLGSFLTQGAVELPHVKVVLQSRGSNQGRLGQGRGRSSYRDHSRRGRRRRRRGDVYQNLYYN